MQTAVLLAPFYRCGKWVSEVSSKLEPGLLTPGPLLLPLYWVTLQRLPRWLPLKTSGMNPEGVHFCKPVPLSILILLQAVHLDELFQPEILWSLMESIVNPASSFTLVTDFKRLLGFAPTIGFLKNMYVEQSSSFWPSWKEELYTLIFLPMLQGSIHIFWMTDTWYINYESSTFLEPY